MNCGGAEKGQAWIALQNKPCSLSTIASVLESQLNFYPASQSGQVWGR